MEHIDKQLIGRTLIVLHKIALGADHRGYETKEYIKGFADFVFFDYGTFSEDRTDYPIYAKAVCDAVLSGDVHGGILCCASGAGMAIAANRNPGIYAAVAWNACVARQVREDDWCNVLVIPTAFITIDDVAEILQGWATATPKEGRYKDRLEQID